MRARGRDVRSTDPRPSVAVTEISRAAEKTAAALGCGWKAGVPPQMTRKFNSMPKNDICEIAIGIVLGVAAAKVLELAFTLAAFIVILAAYGVIELAKYVGRALGAW